MEPMFGSLTSTMVYALFQITERPIIQCCAALRIDQCGHLMESLNSTLYVSGRFCLIRSCNNFYSDNDKLCLRSLMGFKKLEMVVLQKIP